MEMVTQIPTAEDLAIDLYRITQAFDALEQRIELARQAATTQGSRDAYVNLQVQVDTLYVDTWDAINTLESAQLIDFPLKQF